MSNPRLWFIAALAALAGAYAASSLYIGHRLTQEAALYSQALSARPDVHVTRLEYAREYRRGTLHYDLTWQELRFAGTLPFRHGPWTGWEGGFALARSEGAIALPGEAPVLALVAVATFGGELDARFAAVDYRDAFEFAGLSGRVRTDARLERLLLDLRLQDFAVDGYELLGGEIALSLRDFDFDDLSTLSLTVERLNLSLAGPDDITGRIEIAFAGEQPLSLARPQSVALALRVSAEFRMSESALRHVAGVVATRDLPPEATEAERTAAADAFYEEALAGLELLPFFSVGEDHVTASLAISEGRLLADGIEFMDITAILVMMLATLAGPAD